MQKFLILDTSILCVLLGVPGKETCGAGRNVWNKRRVDALLKKEMARATTLVLPLAAIIETGNHIAQATSRRYETAQALADIIRKAADESTPWAAFTRQSEFWGPEGLKRLAATWPALAAQEVSLGDATILTVAEYYARIGFEVEILTGDEGLKSHQPTIPSPPRRHRR